jgi:hypothetical protein
MVSSYRTLTRQCCGGRCARPSAAVRLASSRQIRCRTAPREGDACHSPQEPAYGCRYDRAALLTSIQASQRYKALPFACHPSQLQARCYGAPQGIATLQWRTWTPVTTLRPRAKNYNNISILIHLFSNH